MKSYLVKVAAGVTVAVICLLAGSYWQFRKDQARLDAAPRVYVDQLDRLIQRAANEGEENALMNARAIVEARNSLGNSLSAITRGLDGEIDRLAAEIGQPKFSPATVSGASAIKQADRKSVYLTILVLQRVWPAKKAQIEVEIRKTLAEMGLPVSAAPVPEPNTSQETPVIVKTPVSESPSPTPAPKSDREPKGRVSTRIHDFTWSARVNAQHAVDAVEQANFDIEDSTITITVSSPTEIRAIEAGVISKTNQNSVEITLENKGETIIYKGLSATSVAQGAKVDKHQPIGRLDAAPAKLFLEYRRDGKTVRPI